MPSSAASGRRRPGSRIPACGACSRGRSRTRSIRRSSTGGTRRPPRHVRRDRRHRRDVAARLDRPGLAVPRVGARRRRARPADPRRHPPPERPDPARSLRERLSVRRARAANGPTTRPRCDPGVHERKWEPDSLLRVLSPLRWLLGGKPARSGRSTPRGGAPSKRRFGRCGPSSELDGPSPYRFHRPDGDPTDDVPNNGAGAPTRPNGMIHGAFRPSDDAPILPFNVPVNLALAAALEEVAALADALDERSLAAEGRSARRGRSATELRATGSSGRARRRSGRTRSTASVARC